MLYRQVDEDDAEAIDMEAVDESETASRAGGSNSKTLDEQRNGKALADHRIRQSSKHFGLFFIFSYRSHAFPTSSFTIRLRHSGTLPASFA